MPCAATKARGTGMMRLDFGEQVIFFKEEEDLSWVVASK